MLDELVEGQPIVVARLSDLDRRQHSRVAQLAQHDVAVERARSLGEQTARVIIGECTVVVGDNRGMYGGGG